MFVYYSLTDACLIVSRWASGIFLVDKILTCWSQSFTTKQLARWKHNSLCQERLAGSAVTFQWSGHNIIEEGLDEAELDAIEVGQEELLEIEGLKTSIMLKIISNRRQTHSCTSSDISDLSHENLESEISSIGSCDS